MNTKPVVTDLEAFLVLNIVDELRNSLKKTEQNPQHNMIETSVNEREKTLKRSIDLCTGFLIAILNAIEIIMITKIKRKKRIYEIILMSLSVSDCLFGVSNIVVSLVFLSHSEKYRDLLEAVYTIHGFFVLTSVFHLMFIGADRLMIVLIPFKYDHIFSRKRLKIATFMIWILAFGIGVSTYATYELTHSESASDDKPTKSCAKNCTSQKSSQVKFQKNIQLVLSIIIIVLDFFMVLCYSTIIYQMWYKTEDGKTIKNDDDEHLPILCVIIASVFVLFTLPYAMCRLLIGKVRFWANFTLLLNSGMNSVVYFFRRRIEKCQRKRSKRCQTESTKNVLNIKRTLKTTPKS